MVEKVIMKNVVVTGNFDGVHLGHRKVFEKAIEVGKERGFNTLAFTFDVHPRSFFNPADPVFVITPLEEKKRLILSCGIDRVESVKFDRVFADLSAEEFVLFLKEKYNCACIVCGEDFHFGKGGEGNVENLGKIGEKNGVEVFPVSLKTLVYNNKKICSTAVREYVAAGDMKGAYEMLGRLFSLEGEVVHGKGKGSLWGFPTVNTNVNGDRLLPKTGVYATFVKADEDIYLGVTNVGYCPTVSNGQKISVETNIIKSLGSGSSSELDFYGKRLKVGFVEYLRPEKKFDTVEELKEEIDRNKAYTVTQYNDNYKKFVNF